MEVNYIRAVQAETTSTFTQTTYTATEWVTRYAPSLTVTKLG